MTNLPCERLLVIISGPVTQAELESYLSRLRLEVAREVLSTMDIVAGQVVLSGAPQGPQTTLVLPASEEFLAAAARGHTPAVAGPIVFAPAMAESSWSNPVVRTDVASLRSQGHYVIEPIALPGERVGPTVELVITHTMHVVFRQLREAMFRSGQ